MRPYFIVVLAPDPPSFPWHLQGSRSTRMLNRQCYLSPDSLQHLKTSAPRKVKRASSAGEKREKVSDSAGATVARFCKPWHLSHWCVTHREHHAPFGRCGISMKPISSISANS